MSQGKLKGKCQDSGVFWHHVLIVWSCASIVIYLNDNFGFLNQD